MSQDSSLLTLLKTYLKDYENIDENIYTVIANYLNTGKDPDTQEKMNIDTLPRTAPAEGEPDNRIWRNSLSSLLTELHNNFEVMRDESEEHKQEYLNYANNMKIILNKSRIDVEDLNDNFKLITTGLNRVFAELFSARTETNNKYQSMFNSIMKEIIPLWENVMYLWLAFLLKERDNIQVPVVKFVYTDKTLLDDIVDELMPYIDEYPDSHLCLIPIIKMNNYYLNYYAQQGYPGIFYHAPNFNSKVFKCERKFLFYQFVPFNRAELNYGLARAGCINDGRSDNLYLGHKAYGHKIVTNDLYFAAPLDEIHSIKEIYPKTYYSQIRVKPSFEMYVHSGALEIKNLTFTYYDVFNSEKLIGTYDASNITLELSKGLEELKTATKYSLAAQIIFRQGITDEEISCPLTKKTNFRNTNIKLTGFDEECICGPATSAEEDYEYLIEYVPLAARSGAAIEDAEPLITTEDLSYIKANYVGSSSESNSLYNKDNDLLDQHYDWDREQNNIVEDKFVLRIGQHWEGDAYIYDNLSSDKKALIPDECKHNATRSYFDYSYGTQDITEKQSNIEYYNKGTVEVGAYLNIPFIKNRHKKLFYYPDFLSHTYGSEKLIPLTSIAETNNSNYISNDNIFRDYPIDKNVYFQIYTKDGSENFDNDNWCIKMIEVISQDAPEQENFFNNEVLPPYTNSTLEELYNYYTSLNIGNIDGNILPFFSQLCPKENLSVSQNKHELPTQYKESYKNHIKQQYKSVVEYFFEGNDREAAYEDITQKLLTSSAIMEYPIHYTKEIYGRNLNGEMVNSGETDIYKIDLKTMTSDDRYTQFQDFDSRSTISDNASLLMNTKRLYSTDDDNPNSDKHIYYRLGIYGSESKEEIQAKANYQNPLWTNTEYRLDLIDKECLDAIYVPPEIKGHYATVNGHDSSFYQLCTKKGGSSQEAGHNQTEYYPGEYIQGDRIGRNENGPIYATESCCITDVTIDSNMWIILYLSKKINNPESGFYDKVTIQSALSMYVEKYIYYNAETLIKTDISTTAYKPLFNFGYPYIQDFKDNPNLLCKNSLYSYYYNSSYSPLPDSQKNKIIDYSYLYEGFGCTHRLFAENVKTYIDFLIFGANFPFVSSYGDNTDYPLNDFYTYDTYTEGERGFNNPIVRNGVFLFNDASAYAYNPSTYTTYSSDQYAYPAFGIIEFRYNDTYILQLSETGGYPSIPVGTGSNVAGFFNPSNAVLRPKPISIFSRDSTAASDFNSPPYIVPQYNGGLFLFNSTLKPFFNIFYYPIEKISSIEYRQYPYIYFLSDKTLLPKNIFLQKYINKKINFKVFKNNQNCSAKDIFNNNINNNDIPYPFPNTKETTSISVLNNTNNITPTFSDAFDFLLSKQVSNMKGIDSSDGSIRYADYFPYFLNFTERSSILGCTLDSAPGFDRPITFGSPTGLSGGTLGYDFKKLFEKMLNNNITKYSIGLPAGICENTPTLRTRGMTALHTFNVSRFIRAGAIIIPNISINDFKVSFKSINSLSGQDTNQMNLYRNTSNININTKFNFEKTDNIGIMNTKIIIHYFGPKKNGVNQYARKILTRQTVGTPNSLNYFVVDGTKELTYQEWTNTWQQSYFNQQQFEDFESNLSNLSVFKQSPSLIYDDSGTTRVLDFEDNPNAGTYLTPQQKQDQELHII